MKVLSEIKLSYNRREVSSKTPTSSKEMNDLIHSIMGDISLQEKMFALFFDIKMTCIGFLKVADGGIDSVLVDARLIYATALNTACKSVVLCHNHPSGNTNPSNADKEITKRIKTGLKTLDITLIDHLITTPSKKYYSFADECIL